MLLGGLSLLLAGTAFLIARKFGGLVFVTVFYGLLALSGAVLLGTPGTRAGAQIWKSPPETKRSLPIM